MLNAAIAYYPVDHHDLALQLNTEKTARQRGVK